MVDELEQAIVERRGELIKVIGDEGYETYIYEVILSDDSTRTYGSNQPPAGED